MLTSCYTSAERGKVQGANDFIMSAVVAFASFSSGKLLAAAGWDYINIAIFPIALLALLLIVWQSWRLSQSVAKSP